jgi:urease accessory protein
MRRATDMARRGDWPAAEAAATVTLDYDLRHRRRIALRCDDGGEVMLDLERATVLREGDGLKLDCGGWVTVRAAPEELVEIRCDTAALCLSVAWHLGNRHLPVQIIGDALRIRPDHVIVAMVQGLGATVAPCRAPFDPESGAYDHHTGEGDGHHAGEGAGHDR